jgi:MFS transporter, DHA1 family, multidrug resistance protein
MFASTVSILATDLYAPSLPALSQFFSVPPEAVQLTMTLNLAGFAAGQLLYGPISDRFGRRPAMLFGIGAFTLMSAACALAWSIEALVTFRILQGVVAACEAVVAWAVIKEVYGEKDGLRIIAIYSIVIAAAPAVGPIVGGEMLVRFGWRSNFWLLCGLAFLSWLAIWLFLKETTRPDPAALRPSRLAAEAGRTLRVPLFWLYTIGPAAALGGMFAFVTEGPFVLIEQLGVPADEFGYYYAAIVAVLIVTNILLNRYGSRFEGRTLLRLGSLLSLTGGALGIALGLTGAVTAWSLCIALAFFVASIALVYAVAPLKALSSTPAAAGTASSWRGFLEMSGAMAGSAIVRMLHDGSFWPLVTVLAGASVCIAASELAASIVERRAARVAAF